MDSETFETGRCRYRFANAVGDGGSVVGAPARLQSEGYAFRYPDLAGALKSIT